MSKLRIVKGNAFTTLINITAISPSGEAVVWSLTDSTNIEVSAVSKTKKVLLSHTIVNANELTAVWKGNLPVATYGIEVKGTYNGRAWRLMDEAVLDIVFSNEEACIPEDSIVDGGYLFDTDIHLVGGTSAQADWTEDDPSKSGYIKHKPDLAEVATSGSYSDLMGLPTIPTRVGQLTNDAGYVTSSMLSGYATEEWVHDAWDAYDQEYHMTTAYTTATAAASAASAADGKAVAAQSAAAAAATAASTADTKATNAQTTANSASSAASTADTKATAAQTRADNAYTLANTANNTANAALPASTIWSGTQAQYDALTAAQKAAVIAFIEEE